MRRGFRRLIGTRFPRWLVLAGAGAVSASCVYLPREPVAPLKVIVEEPETTASELVVLLPGRWSLPEEFGEEGFTALVRKHHPRARIVAPDLHLSYYRDRSAIERLHRDVIEPARSVGLNEVTLIGISMGGLGATLYDLEHPETGANLVLLSPFLGDEEVIAEIEKAGGLDQWKPAEPEPEDFSRRLWLGLKNSWPRPQSRAVGGCGMDDRLAPASRLLARELLPADGMHWIPGDHDWPTWKAVFEKISSEREQAPRR